MDPPFITLSFFYNKISSQQLTPSPSSIPLHGINSYLIISFFLLFFWCCVYKRDSHRACLPGYPHTFKQLGFVRVGSSNFGLFTFLYIFFTKI